MAVGLATKNATQTFCTFLERMQQQQQRQQQGVQVDELGEPLTQPQSSTLEAVMSLLASEKGEQVLSLLITKSIKTAISTYVDATLGYNVYDDMVASIAKQEHRDAVSDIMSRVTASLCRELVTAYQRTAGRAGQPPYSNSGNPPSRLSSSLSSASSSVTSIDGHTTPTGHATSMAASGSATPCTVAVELLAAGSPTSSSAVVALVAQPGSKASLRAACQRRHSGDAGASAQLPPMATAGQGGGHHHPPHHHQHRANASRQAAALLPLGNPWIKQVADLAREQEVRSLALDVVKSATREATRSTLETLLGSGGGGTRGLVGQLVAGSQYQMSVVLSVLLAVVMYAAAPRTILG